MQKSLSAINHIRSFLAERALQQAAAVTWNTSASLVLDLTWAYMKLSNEYLNSFRLLLSLRHSAPMNSPQRYIWLVYFLILNCIFVCLDVYF